MLSIDKFINEVENITAILEKRELEAQYKEMGYSVRCKVCNHPDVDEIEKLREDGYTYENIIDKLNLDLSVMSLSRHFKNHYPKKTSYKLKRKKLMLESVIEAIQKYPYLEDYFKDKDYEEIKEFTEVRGFCTDCFKLCDLIPANKVLNSYEIQKILLEGILNDLENNSSYLYRKKPDKDTFNLLLGKEKCLNCKNSILTKRLEIFEKIITLQLGNSDIKPSELLYTCKVEYNGDMNSFYDYLITVFNENEKK